MGHRNKIKAASLTAMSVLAVVLYAITRLSTGAVIVKGPYLQNPGTDSITVMWETKTDTASVVRYGTGGKLDQSAPGGNGTLHEVRLNGLRPDTYYAYSVSSDGAASEVYGFRTAPVEARPFRFVAFGDSRSNPATVEKISSMVARLDPPAEFAVHTGDVVDDGDELEEWDEDFFRPQHPMMAVLPVYFALGNHDKGSKYYFGFFDLPGNERWYSFTYSNAAFICLDTNSGYSPGSGQYDWLAGKLQEYADTPWLFVFMHDPPFSTGFHGGDESVRETLVPLFEEYGVDMVICGHDHDYERSVVGGVTYVVTGGYGAPTRRQMHESPHTVKFSQSHHFCVLDVDGDSMTMTVTADDGGIIETVEWPER